MKKPLLLSLSIFILFTAAAQQLAGVSVNLFTYMDNNERTLQDGVGVLFNGQSDSVDLSDARKLVNPLENIAILRNNILLGIEQRTTFDTIPLTMWNLMQRDYELEIFSMNIADVYLEDVAANSRQYIGTGDTLRYRFTNPVDSSPQDLSVKYRLLFTVTPNGNGCGGNRLPRRRRNEEKTIRLYPNPVFGDYINVEMRNLSAGFCRVTVLGSIRSLTHEFNHGNSCNERINTAELPQGKYYLIIEDEEGWKEARQIEIR